MFGSSNGTRAPRGLGSNQQTGGMNLTVQNRQGSRKGTNLVPGHSLLGHFGLIADAGPPGSFPVPGDPDYIPPDPDVAREI